MGREQKERNRTAHLLEISSACSEFLTHVGVKADRLLREITPIDIRSWRDALKRKGLAAPTVNDAIKTLRMPFKAAHDAGYIEINPCTKNSVRPVKDEGKPCEPNGPLVLEVPPMVLGPLDDAWFRWVTDVGMTGPDKGKGGKYLLLPPGYKGQIPDGYFVAHSRTFENLLFFRTFLKDGDPKPGGKRWLARARSMPARLWIQTAPRSTVERPTGYICRRIFPPTISGHSPFTTTKRVRCSRPTSSFPQSAA